MIKELYIKTTKDEHEEIKVILGDENDHEYR